MFDKLRSLKLFLKYFFSYLAILFIPFIISTVFFNNRYIEILKNEITNNNHNVLLRIQDAMDQQLRALESIAFQITMNSNLRPWYLGNNQNRALIIKKELQKYNTPGVFIDEIVLYYNNDNTVYTSRGSFPISRFLALSVFYKDVDKEIFMRLLNETVSPKEFLSNGDFNNDQYGHRYITHLLPLTLPQREPFGMVMVIYKEAKYRDMIARIVPDQTISIGILNKDLELIIPIGNIDYLKEAVNYPLSQIDIQKDSISLQDEKLLLTMIESQKTGWTFISLVPLEIAFSKVTEILNIILFSFILLILVGGVIIYISMRLNYRPLKRLKALSLINGMDNFKNLDEIETVKSVLEQYSRTNQGLRSRINQDKTALKDFLLLGLIEGKFSNLETFNREGADIGLSFKGPYYMVLILKLTANQEKISLSNNEIISRVETLLPDAMEGYGMNSFISNRLVFIISTELENTVFIQDHIKELSRTINLELSISITICAGNLYRNTNMLAQSYLEASKALQFCFIKGTNKTVFFEDSVPGLAKPDVYPKREIEKLEMAITGGDVDTVHLAVQNIFTTVQAEDTSLFLAKCICHELINMIIRTLKKLENIVWIEKADYPNVFVLDQFNSIEEMIELVDTTSTEICSLINQDSERSVRSQIGNIIQYINEHYTECNFSVQEIADNFGISSSSLSQLFKKNTGKKVVDYISNLRIEESKRLLVETNLTVKNIVEAVGYHDFASFVRKFKKRVGVTPGRYRSLKIEV